MRNIAVYLIIGATMLFPLSASADGFFIDGQLADAYRSNDWPLREMDSCYDELSGARVYMDSNRFLPLVGYLDAHTGGPLVDEVAYTTGDDVLPLKVERIYKVARRGLDSELSWFGNEDYSISVGDGLKSAEDLFEPDGCSLNGANHGQPSSGLATRPILFNHGLDGTFVLNAEISDEDKHEFGWVRMSSLTSGNQIDLKLNKDGTWIYRDKDAGTIEIYKETPYGLKLYSMTDAATGIAQIYSYGSNYTKITRTGGSWIKYIKGNSGNYSVETSSGKNIKYNTVNNGTSHYQTVSRDASVLNKWPIIILRMVLWWIMVIEYRFHPIKMV